jgi:CheY-like chemotaxis protein
MPSQLPIIDKTVLVVNDSSGVLAVISSILRNSGFTVLAASTTEAAIQISLEFPGNIHLLLTEAMMPGMSGPDLAAYLRTSRTNLRVMMMKGYANGDLLVLNYGWLFARQPSVAKILTDLVNDIVSSVDRSQGADQFDTREGHTEVLKKTHRA